MILDTKDLKGMCLFFVTFALISEPSLSMVLSRSVNNTNNSAGRTPLFLVRATATCRTF